MIQENDKYVIPKDVLSMSHKQIKIELDRASKEMASHSDKKPKKQTKRNIKFNF